MSPAGTDAAPRRRAPRKGKAPMDPARRAMLRELKKVAADIQRLEGLYERRYELVRDLRALDPPVPQAELAEICGTSPNAITQLINASKWAGNRAKKS